MRILYGVAGEGFGHASHALEITKFLEEKGHEIIILTYDRAYDVLKDKFNVVKVNGINLIYKKGKLRLTKSIFINLGEFSKNTLKIKMFHKLMTSFRPELCISDMEPIVPVLSHIYHLPLISLSNQNRFTRYQIDCPLKYKKDYHIAKLTIKLATPMADDYITLSFSKMKRIKPNSFLARPIIREEVRKAKPRDKDHVVVYLSKENEPLLEILKTVDENFVVYGCGPRKKDNNLEFKSSKEYIKDFINCKAIISTSGFTSISEAIYLKKPYLAVPLKGHFEQIFNALFLKRQKLGFYSEKLTKPEIEQFLKDIPFYKNNLKKYKINLPDSKNVLLELINRLNKPARNS